MAVLMPNGKAYYTTSTGAPLAGGKVYTYAAGTATPLSTFSDAAGVTPNANPVILDARGEATIFWNGNYKVILKDSADVTIWTVDNINSTGTSNASIARDGTLPPTAAIGWNGQNLTGVAVFGATGAATLGSTLTVAGNAGFGTVTPGSQSDVWGVLRVTNSAASAQYVAYSVTSNIHEIAAVAGVSRRMSADGHIWRTAAGAEIARIDTANARLGIMTAAPSQPLHVVGNAQLAGGAWTPTVGVTTAATTTVDCSLANVFTTTMGANIATLTLSNPHDGQTVNIFFTQDGTGSRTVTWPASFKWPGATVPVLTTTASRTDYLVATYIAATGFWHATLTKDSR